MKAEYINPFITATVSVFDEMLNCKLSRGDPFVKDGNLSLLAVSGVIGFSGKAKGTVVISLCREAALTATEKLRGARPVEIDENVVDMVGELTNIVAGAAKGQLEHLALKITLPTVVTGKSHSIEFPSSVTPICIPFHCEWGEVIVEFGLLEQPAEVPVGA